jgi:WD40 repeat protein
MAGEHPEQFGDYRLLREIGRGGMGIVYEAEQVSLGRRVALKVLPPQHGDPLLRQRFEREAKAAARLHHTNIVPVFGVGTQDGQPYYVMQFIRGLGLDQVLVELQRLRHGSSSPARPPDKAAPSGKDLSAADMARSLLTGAYPGSGPVTAEANPAEAATVAPQSNADLPGPPTKVVQSPVALSAALLSGQGEGAGKTAARQQTYWQRVAGLGVQVAEALGYAHKQGVLHRDIKPSNLLLDTRGAVWITDFGLAKAQDQQNLTQTGEILGTLRYMPAEAYEGRSDGRSDQYALGLTLYELLTLRPAFDSSDRLKLITQICSDEPVRPRSLDPHIPRDLETIVLKAMEKDSRRRYPTAEEMAEDLQRFVNNEPIKARPLGVRERLTRWCRRNPVIACLIAALVVVLLAGLAGVSWKWREAVWQRERTDEARQETLHERDKAVAQREKTRRLLYASDMNVALQAWEAGDLRRAQDLLDRQWPTAGQEDLRDFTWRYLWRLCQGDEQLTIPGSAGPAVFAPNGQTLAVVRGSAVDLWDTASGQVRTTLAGQAVAVTSVVFAPDGKTLATGSQDNVVRLWDVAARRQTATLAGVEVLHFAADGKTLASRGQDGTLLRWDVALRRKLPSLDLNLNKPVLCVAFSPDGKTLATGDTDRRVRLWDVATGKAIDLEGHTAWVPGVAFSPDGKRLASCSHDGTAILWDVAQRRRIVRLPAHHAQVLAVAFSPDAQLLATGSDDATIKLWNTTTFQQVGMLRSPSGYTGVLSFSPDGSTLASGGRDGSVKLWPVVLDDDKGVFARHSGWTSSLAFSPDGKLLAAADTHDNSAKVWDAATHKLVARLAGKQGMTWQVAFSPDGKSLAVAGNGVRRWDLTTLPAVPTLHAEAGAPVGGSAWGYLGFSADGRFLVGADLLDARNAAGTLWNAQLRPVAAPWREKDPKVLYVAFARVGHTVAVCRPNRTIELWDLESGRETGKLTGQTGDLSSAAFSPDDTALATGSNDGTVRLWDLSEGQVRFSFAGHTAIVHGIAFSPDGKTLATTSKDGTVKLWNTEIGQEVGTLKIHRGPVTSAAFTPDGNTLATTGADATIRMSQAAAPQEVRRLQRASAEDLARQGDWQGAAQQLARAVGRNPAHSVWPIYLANVQLQLRDFEGYRRLCRQRAQALAHTPLSANDANNTAWLCCLGPDAVADYPWPVALAEGAVVQAPDEQSRGLFLNTLGSILYRAGRHQDAVDRLSGRLAESKTEGFPQDWAFLALAHHRLGHHAEARRWLDKLRAYKPADDPRNSPNLWNDLEISLLRREAEELLAADRP